MTQKLNNCICRERNLSVHYTQNNFLDSIAPLQLEVSSKATKYLLNRANIFLSQAA